MSFICIYLYARAIAGLTLKTIKCLIVPLCQLSEKRRNDIIKWIARNIPEWREFRVDSCTKLLGFYIGPDAGRVNWTEQAQKILTRVQSIRLSQAAINLNVLAYNTRVVPIPSYIAQLLPPPDRISQIERASLHSVLRLPQNAFCHADFFHLSRCGGPILRSITTASFAAHIRTSIKTLTSWRAWIHQLSEAAVRFLPLEPLVRDALTTSCWDSPPLAVNLREAFSGLPNNPNWCISNSELLCKLHRSDIGKMPVQKLLYKELVARRFADSFDDTFQRRLTNLYQPFVLDFNHSISLGSLW